MASYPEALSREGIEVFWGFRLRGCVRNKGPGMAVRLDVRGVVSHKGFGLGVMKFSGLGLMAH